jgi:3'-phosphoadenosine 5'-phosphosulfate (PAPS) 3'-phosphatase
MSHRRYTWVIDPIDGVKAFRTVGNGNYCISVTLYIGISPVMRLAFYPEYELEGVAGVLFESNETKEVLIEKSEEIYKECVEK